MQRDALAPDSMHICVLFVHVGSYLSLCLVNINMLQSDAEVRMRQLDNKCDDPVTSSSDVPTRISSPAMTATVSLQSTFIARRAEVGMEDEAQIGVGRPPSLASLPHSFQPQQQEATARTDVSVSLSPKLSTPGYSISRGLCLPPTQTKGKAWSKRSTFARG